MELIVHARTGQKAKQLLKAGLIPAIIYGKKFGDPKSVSCVKNDFLRRYKEAGYATPLTLKGEGINQMVLIQELQLDPVTDNLMHIDFLAVSQDQKVRTEIPIILQGESSVEKLGEGKIQLIKDFVEVEAFPQDLPKNVIVDISVIQTMNDTIFVKDLKFSDKVTVITDLDQPILTVVTLQEEEAAATPVAGAATTATTPAGEVKEGDAKEGAKDEKKGGKDDKKSKDDKK